MRPIDGLVYVDPNGHDYVAQFEDLGWQRWPAENGGWVHRAACKDWHVHDCFELEPRLAQLALRLSGVR